MNQASAAGIIYCARNKLNGKVYIGQTTKSLGNRERRHRDEAKRGKDSDFRRAIRKSGLEGFEWDMLCSIEAPTSLLLKEYLNITEQIFIKQYDSTNLSKGYNRTQGGVGSVGLRPSIETREKMSKSRIGIRYTAETIEKMSKAKKGINHPMFGKEISDGHKRKIAESNKRRSISPEIRKKISESLKRKHLSNDEFRKRNREQLKKLSEDNKGSHRSDDTRKKMSESARRKWARGRAA